MRRLVLWGVVVMAVAGSALPSATAGAVPAAVPVAVADVVRITPSMDVEVDVLANDAGGDPVGADLQVCRIDAPDDDLAVQIWSHNGSPGFDVIPPGSTYLDVTPARPLPAGDYLVEYAACDRERTAWATLTVEVRRVRAVRVQDSASAVELSNPLDFAIFVYWVGPDRKAHARRVGPHKTRVVEAGPDHFRWFAFTAVEESDLPLDGGRVGAARAARSGARQVVHLPRASAAVLVDDAPDVVPPVTAPDHVTLDYYDSVDLAVLANDSDDHPDDLAICRVDVPTDVGLDALPEPWWDHGRSDDPQYLEVGASAGRPGTYKITYYACDREQLTPETLTVTVRRFRHPLMRTVPGRPGVVRIRNRGYRTIDVQYFKSGHYSEKFHLVVRPGRTRVLHVDYDAMGYFVDTKIGPLMSGTLHGLQQRR